MKLTHEDTNEGHLLLDSETGRAFCRVHVRRIESTNDPNLRVQKNVPVALATPHVHFTGIKLSPAELTAVAGYVDELLKLPAIPPAR